MRPDQIADGLLKLGEFPSWWWNPNNPEAIQPVPDDVTSFLLGVDPELRVTWNKVACRWNLWAPPSDANNKVVSSREYAQWCVGYKLLATLEDSEGKFLPLTVNTLTHVMALVLAERKGGSLEVLKHEELRSYEAGRAREADDEAQRDSWSRDAWAHMRPSVGPGGISKSKTAVA